MDQSVEITGHRGASFDAPENTVAAAELAWKQGANRVEIDIRTTLDGRLVVLHDSSTKRTTGTKGEAASMLFDDLRRLDAGSWKDAKYAGEKVPALEELIATVPEGRGLMVEIKEGPEAALPLKTVLEASGRSPDEFIIVSFNYESAKAAKAAMPACKAFLISAYLPDEETGKLPHDLPDLIRLCREANLDGLHLSYLWPIDEAFVKQVREAGLHLHTWTVDDPVVAKNLVRAGVDGILTNRPGWLRQELLK